MMEQTVDLDNIECRMIGRKGSGTPIIFLHGYVFTSEVWDEIGLFKALEENGIPFFALDMPYGSKNQCSSRTSDPELNVRIVEKVAEEEPDIVIVGASLGGYIALKYSVKNPVKGLLLIGPTGGMEDELVKSYQQVNALTTIIYGEEDSVVSLGEMKELSKALNAELKIYEKAQHPAYLDYPEKFREDVLNFYNSIQK